MWNPGVVLKVSADFHISRASRHENGQCRQFQFLRPSTSQLGLLYSGSSEWMWTCPPRISEVSFQMKESGWQWSQAETLYKRQSKYTHSSLLYLNLINQMQHHHSGLIIFFPSLQGVLGFGFVLGFSPPVSIHSIVRHWLTQTNLVADVRERGACILHQCLFLHDQHRACQDSKHGSKALVGIAVHGFNLRSWGRKLNSDSKLCSSFTCECLLLNKLSYSLLYFWLYLVKQLEVIQSWYRSCPSDYTDSKEIILVSFEI